MENTLDTLAGSNSGTDPVAASPSKRYLNVNELAALLGVSRWTIFRLCTRKEIPFIPYGRIKRFDRLEIQAAIARRTIKARI